jgi:hypothetical protein
MIGIGIIQSFLLIYSDFFIFAWATIILTAYEKEITQQ